MSYKENSLAMSTTATTFNNVPSNPWSQMACQRKGRNFVQINQFKTHLKDHPTNTTESVDADSDRLGLFAVQPTHQVVNNVPWPIFGQIHNHIVDQMGDLMSDQIILILSAWDIWSEHSSCKRFSARTPQL